MNKNQWDIWSAKVYFENDPAQFKNRPVIVLDEDTFLCTALYVTSKEKDERYAYKLLDWEGAGLKTQSYVKLEPIELNSSDFNSYIGTLRNIDIIKLGDALLYRKF